MAKNQIYVNRQIISKGGDYGGLRRQNQGVPYGSAREMNLNLYSGRDRKKQKKEEENLSDLGLWLSKLLTRNSLSTLLFWRRK